MQEINYKIYLAGLLHDIGKLVYRSKPSGSGGHEELGEQFIREQLAKIRFLSAADIEEIVRFSKHHSVASYVRIADHIVSSERDNEESKEARRPLVSIFSQLADAKNKNSVWFYEPSEIDINNVFASKREIANGLWSIGHDEERHLISMHEDLLINLKKDFLKLSDVKSYKQLADCIYFLSEKYTSRITSAGYMSLPDVSLFDHNRALAGVVNCLIYGKTVNELNEYDPSVSGEKMLLVKGDISGIQKFIYSNISLESAGSGKQMAKKLRGRSFYVSLLTDFLSSKLVSQIGLAQANVIFSGGGHFILLLPDKADVKEAIENYEIRVNKFLIEKIGLHLSLNFSIAECDTDLFVNSSKYFKILSDKLDQKKNKRFESYLPDVFNAVKFRPHTPNSETFSEDIDIGKVIPHSNFLLEIETVENGAFSESLRDAIVCSFPLFKTYFVMLDKFREVDRLFRILKENENKIVSINVVRLNSTDFLDIAEKFSAINCPISYSFRFVGKEAPTDDKDRELLSFEELSKLDYESGQLSYPQLAVMRLDVDNLGTLFAFGLGDKGTFSRVATMSREMHLFFSGYFNILAEKYKLYITYSGGDDAFVIGSWFNVMHFAKDFYLTFQKFACYNDRVHFSAGIFMCNSSYPVAKFADDAAIAEHLAKQFNSGQKNAITVFDHTLSWADYCSMLEFSEVLLSYTKSDNEKGRGRLARSMAHRILRIIKSCMSSDGSVNAQKMYENLAHLHYLFARHGFDHEQIQKATEGVENAVIKVILQNFSKEKIIKNFTIPMHYVVLKTRELSK